MKNTLLRTVVILVALCIYPSIHAYDFEYDGFYYDMTTEIFIRAIFPYPIKLRIMGRLIKSRLSKLMPSKGKNN